MAKRNANTGICIPRRSPRLQKLADEERKLALARITARITGIEVMTVNAFNCLYHTKKIITLARPPEDDLPKNGNQRFTYLYSIVMRFIDLLARSDLMVEKLTFENLAVTETQLHRVLRHTCLPTLKSITFKGDYHRRNGWFNLSRAFSIQNLPGDNVRHYLDINTYELPETSVLETLSFEPGLKKPTTNDIRALNYLVEKNPRIKSIKVLNSDSKQVKGTISYSKKKEKKDFLQAALDNLSERALTEYHSKLERLVKEDLDQSLFINLKALLWSQTVAKLLSDPSSIPGIFDKDDHSVYSLRTDLFFQTWSFRKENKPN